MADLFFGSKALWNNSIVLLRIWCGVIFIKYGLTILHNNSVLDFADTLKQNDFPLPVLCAFLNKSVEFFGGTLLVAGFLKRIASTLLIINMLVATFVFHHGLVLSNGLTTFLLLLCLMVILLTETDSLSFDHWLFNKKTKK
jgi:uncharacterized membrane protein YphA (DoxX/SURF4 family)